MVTTLAGKLSRFDSCWMYLERSIIVVRKLTRFSLLGLSRGGYDLKWFHIQERKNRTRQCYGRTLSEAGGQTKSIAPKASHPYPMIPISSLNTKAPRIPSDTCDKRMQWSERVTTSLPFSFAYSNKRKGLWKEQKGSQVYSRRGEERRWKKAILTSSGGHYNWWLRRLPSYFFFIPQVTHLKEPKWNPSLHKAKSTASACGICRDNDKPISLSRHPVGLKTEETIGALPNSGSP